MRRRDGGAGCGACVHGFANRAPGRLRVIVRATTSLCLQWLDAGQASGGESHRAQAHGLPLPGSTIPQTEIAAK